MVTVTWVSVLPQVLCLSVSNSDCCFRDKAYTLKWRLIETLTASYPARRSLLPGKKVHGTNDRWPPHLYSAGTASVTMTAGVGWKMSYLDLSLLMSSPNKQLPGTACKQSWCEFRNQETEVVPVLGGWGYTSIQTDTQDSLYRGWRYTSTQTDTQDSL